MIVPQEMLVEVRDQTAWEVHDALLLCTRSKFESATKRSNFWFEDYQHLFQYVQSQYVQSGDQMLEMKYVPARGALNEDSYVADLQVWAVKMIPRLRWNKLACYFIQWAP